MMLLKVVAQSPHRSPVSVSHSEGMTNVSFGPSHSSNPLPTHCMTHCLQGYGRQTSGSNVLLLSRLSSCLVLLPTYDIALNRMCLWYEWRPTPLRSIRISHACCRGLFVNFFFARTLIVAGRYTSPRGNMLLARKGTHIQTNLCNEVLHGLRT